MAEHRFKAVVIGSGAGGAPAAAVLAKAWGDGVAVLEAGPRMTARDFTQIERDMVPALYAGSGLQATEDGSVTVLQGRVVGGSTVINDALCFRPPEEMVDRWSAYGSAIDWAALNRHADEVEAALGVTQMTREQINRANYLVGLGAARLGWAGERLRHNSPNCVQCGFRHFGCSYNAKQSMNLTYIPAAEEAGARVFSDTEVERVEKDGGGWRVIARDDTFRADIVVLAAGVVQTPAILLRSGIAAGEGLQFHLQTLTWGDFDDPVDAHNGIPMAYGVLEFADVYGRRGPGYLIEGVSNQAMSFSVQPQVQGELHEEILRRYRHLAGAVMLLRSAGRGRVRLSGAGNAVIDYPLVESDVARTLDYYRRSVEMYLAAGARRTLISHRGTGWLAAPPEGLTVAPGMQYLYTAHPFGGANRGTVTDGEGRVKGQQNLWVLDASAFPEALGVNPQITIAALSLEGAARIVGG